MIGFVAMSIGMFMAILDIQVVATSLPTIRAALAIDDAAMSWIQTSYLVAEVIAIPLTGVLTRVLSTRWLFVVAVSCFTFASLGCARSTGFAALVAWRALQGFSGGTLIPAVFAAVFLLFPPRHQPVATTLAGMLAVLAPTVGPVVGGWITQTYSWHWLFLINIGPGILAAITAGVLLPRQRTDVAHMRSIDAVSLAALAAGLSALEVALTQAPKDGWLSFFTGGLLAASLACGGLFLARTRRAASPIIDLALFSDRCFAVGCALSFMLGAGLYGTIYLMPVFLGLVRGHDALAIGEIMLVTGVVQLLTAPLAVFLETRVDSRLLTVAAFLTFSVGLGLSAFQTIDTDFAGMVLPQVLRGLSIMFCLLAPTNLALGHLAPALVADGSGVFNLMRNLGGAVGLAAIDSLIYGRVPILSAAIVDRLRAGDAAAAKAIGLPPGAVGAGGPPVLSEGTRMLLAGMVKKAALTQAINEAWALLAILTAAAIAALLFVRSQTFADRFGTPMARCTVPECGLTDRI